jgi:flagellar biosynthesis GTPase FlhF
VSKFLENTAQQRAKAAAIAKAEAEAAEKAAEEAAAKAKAAAEKAAAEAKAEAEKKAAEEAAAKALAEQKKKEEEAALAKAAAEKAAKEAAEAKAAKEAAEAAEAAKKAAAEKAKAEAEAAQKAKEFNYKQEGLASWSYVKAPKGSSEWMGSHVFLRSAASGYGLVSYANNAAHGPPVVFWRLGQEGPYAGTLAGNTEYQGQFYQQWKDDSSDGSLVSNLWGYPEQSSETIAQWYPKGSCAAYEPCESRLEFIRIDETRFQIKIQGKDLCLQRSKQTYDVNGSPQWGYFVKWQPCCPIVDNDWDAPGWDIAGSSLPQASCT